MLCRRQLRTCSCCTFGCGVSSGCMPACLQSSDHPLYVVLASMHNAIFARHQASRGHGPTNVGDAAAHRNSCPASAACAAHLEPRRILHRHGEHAGPDRGQGLVTWHAALCATPCQADRSTGNVHPQCPARCRDTPPYRPVLPPPCSDDAPPPDCHAHAACGGCTGLGIPAGTGHARHAGGPRSQRGRAGGR